MTLDADYFDRMYAAAEDPWGFASRWYEQRKYALTLAALPEPRYASALEVGCSVGVLTAQLAGRCDRLVATDLSEAALATARSRVPSHVELVCGGADSWPQGPWDLVVLSEVGYYLDRSDLAALLARLDASTEQGATLLACHWRHPVADYPQTGDEVHAALDRPGWSRLSRVLEEDLVLEVFVRGEAVSVAQRTGLVC